jgi:hypothetical protein
MGKMVALLLVKNLVPTSTIELPVCGQICPNSPWVNVTVVDDRENLPVNLGLSPNSRYTRHFDRKPNFCPDPGSIDIYP